MRSIKVIIHVYNKDLTFAEKSYIKAERVARFGASQEERPCYEPYKDEEVNLCLKFVCWSSGDVVPSFYIPADALRNALEKINLFLL